MKHLGLEFREIQLRLDTPEFKDEVGASTGRAAACPC